MARARIAGLSLVLLVVAIAPARADAAATWIVKGRGFGHGVGMSAYGAYGFGRHGRGYRQILRHYYRGIGVGELRQTPQVRVLLDVSSGDVRFSGAVSACRRQLDPGRTYRAQRGRSGVRLVSGSGRLLAGCGARLSAVGRGAIRIAGVGAYRGALEAVPAGGGLNVVNRVSVNAYVRGVLPRELFPSWPMATLKAFAVAARSIALTTDVGGRGYDLYPDTRTQVYGGVAAETARTDRAAFATRNQVATHRGEVAQTTYFSASGGRTESGFLGGPEIPYLRSVRDPFDYYSPLHRWTFRFSQGEIDTRLGGYVRGRLRRIVVTKRGDSPRIDYARLVGTRGTTTIRGDTLQYALGLYDRWAYFTKVR